MTSNKNIVFDALKNNAFIPFFQPVIDSDDRKCIGAEVLSRLDLGCGRLISPGDFLQFVIGHVNFELKLFDMMLHNAVLMYEKKIFCSDFFLSINITANVMGHELLPAILNKNICDKKNALIVLELTEHFPLNFFDEGIQKNIKILKQMGVMIALDDFGTGYSGLSILQNIDIDFIKVPHNFSSCMSIKSKAIIDNIKHLSDLIGSNVIVEGIETEEQFLYLKSKGFKYMQGYLLGKPLGIDDFILYYSFNNGE